MRILPKRNRPTPMLYVVFVTMRTDELSLVTVIRTTDNAAATFETHAYTNALTAVRFMAEGKGDYTYSITEMGHRAYKANREAHLSVLAGMLPDDLERAMQAIQEVLDESV